MKSPLLLTDEQMQKFIAHGYLCLKTTLPESFHRHIYERFDKLIGGTEANNPGNNLLPTVPELNEIFIDPVVTGALTSTVGPNYVMHPHRALHNNLPGSDAQNLHKDSYWGYRSRVRNHRSRWVMVMYVPQATPPEQGPTGVISGSQYQNRRPDPELMPEVPGSLEAGGFLLIHYDIWHRKMKNFTDRNRFMMKFEFARMENPAEPTWDHRDPVWRLSDLPSVDMSVVWKRQWRWLRNASAEADANAASLSIQDARAGLAANDPHIRLRAINAIAARPETARKLLPELSGLLEDACDPVSIDTAYAMAEAGEPAVQPLWEMMRRYDGEDIDERNSSEVPADYIVNEERIARVAAHGLTEIGPAAVPGCLTSLAEGDARVRKLAAFALGEIAPTGNEVTEALSAATKDPAVTVRVNAVEALGWKPATPGGIAALTSAMRDPAPDVRFSAALSLAQLGPSAEAAVPALSSALTDENRYVPGYAVEALERIATPEAMRTLLPYLKTSRWCSHTSPSSIY
jgi:HEAT repeat protein